MSNRSQMDLLENYPEHPGAKARDTSFAAAEEMKPSAKTLRSRALEIFHKLGPSTADEVAAEMNADVLAIRPRISELARMGKISDSSERRPNASGKMAIVWRVNHGANDA